MADSLGFLAYAGGKRNNFTPWSPNILLYHYGVTPRDDKNFAKEATFQKTSSGIKIERKLLYHDGDIKEGQYTFRPISELYIRGTELLEEARKATARPGWTTNDLARALQPWIDALKQNMVEGKLPPKFLDAAPFNATLTSAGNVQFFDLEWIDSGPVDFLSTVTNHLYHSLDKLGGVYQPSDNTPTAYPELILALLHAWGFTFSLRDLKNCWINAKTLWTHLFKNRPTWEELCMCHVFITPSAITDYKSLQAEHKKIINSFSWKITKPLRKTKTWYVKAKTAFRGNPPKKK